MPMQVCRNGLAFIAGLLALFLVPIGTATAAAAAAADLPSLIKRATPAIVTVVVYDPDLALPSVGTGFLVAPDRVVTARHVLAGADRAAVRTSDGTSIPIAGILAEQRPTDLVLVQLKRPVEDASVLAVSAEAPEVGERLFTVSSPLGLEFSASDGIVSAYRDVPGAGVSMQHTVAVSAGSSGCPLLNERCEVVAVQTGVITTGEKLVHAGQALNFAVSAKLIAALLEPGGDDDGAASRSCGRSPRRRATCRRTGCRRSRAGSTRSRSTRSPARTSAPPSPSSRPR